MIKVTKNLRKYAAKRWSLAKDATDVEVRQFIGKKLFKGFISTDDIERINAADDAGTDATPPKKKGGTATLPTPPKKKTGAGTRRIPKRDDDDRDAGNQDMAKVVRRQVRLAMRKMGGGGQVNPMATFSKHGRIRVKEAVEQYSTARKSAVYPQFRGVGGKMGPHPFAGMPARIGDTNLDHPSDRDKAIALAWVRYMAAKSSGGKDLPRWLKLTDHDRELVAYAAQNEKWIGSMEDRDGNTVTVNRRKLSELHAKTLLDDSTSGGIEITPVVFDDALILTPVLYGELFPFVNVQNVARGRRVKSGSLVNPTFTSGIGEGTAITPFNTASYVSAFDTAIYPAVAAIELGMDFEEDSPVDLGGQVVEQFGFKALEWLDQKVAIGNGFNEPQGIFNAAAATLMNSTFGAGGPLTVSDFEGLMLQGLAKQFRTEPGAFLAFVSNDYTYRKARSIPVGPGDERRVFGMDHASYKMLDMDYKVQNDIPDGYLAAVNLRRYRMYRRLGMQVRIETGGRQLALSNTRLIVVRMRYGGQLEIGGAAALMKDAQVM